MTARHRARTAGPERTATRPTNTTTTQPDEPTDQTGKHNMKNWKASKVYINNQPNQWHVHERQWGGATVAVCSSEHSANLCAAAPDLLRSLQFILQRLEAAGRAAKSDCITQCHWAITKATGAADQ